MTFIHLLLASFVNRRCMSNAVRTTSSSVKFCKINMESEISYINSSIAKQIDETLMQQPGFSIDQLMELAGLSVAESVLSYTRDILNASQSKNSKVLLLCGPGNNGGDGLVASRHLKHFGFEPEIYYPKPGKGQLFTNLIKQCQDLSIPFHENSGVVYQLISSQYYTIIVDSLFGFSFDGPPREPFAGLISSMASSSTPVLSVDIPSGWSD